MSGKITKNELANIVDVANGLAGLGADGMISGTALPAAIGSYTGDGTDGRFISLGFTPRLVIVTTAYDGYNCGLGVLLTGGTSCFIAGDSTDIANSSITTNGLSVNKYRAGGVAWGMNWSGLVYRYIAFK